MVSEVAPKAQEFSTGIKALVKLPKLEMLVMLEAEGFSTTFKISTVTLESCVRV